MARSEQAAERPPGRERGEPDDEAEAQVEGQRAGTARAPQRVGLGHQPENGVNEPSSPPAKTAAACARPITGAAG